MKGNVLLEVNDLKKYFPIRKGLFKKIVGHVRAVDGVDLVIREGETLGLVGESGCGKTTVGRTVLRLIDPTAGSILFQSRSNNGSGVKIEPVDIVKASPRKLKTLRREMQIIYQDPYSSLNPRMKVWEIIGEPLIVHGLSKRKELKDRVKNLLEAVGLNADHMGRYSHEFSGGQRQRIGIARGLALEPRLIIADEPVSALDVSIQAQILNLLEALQKQFGHSYLFITHDLSVIKYISSRVVVMYLGKIAESAATERLFFDPKHPYTEALMSAVPVPDPEFKAETVILKGDVPSPANPPSGCYFHPRCPYMQRICAKESPIYRDLGDEHFVSCHFADTLHLRPLRAGA